MSEYTFYKCLFSTQMEYNPYFENLDYDPRHDTDDYHEIYYVELSDGQCLYTTVPVIRKCDLINGQYLLKEEFINAYMWKETTKNSIDKLFEEQKKRKDVDIIEIKYDELPPYAKQLWEIYLKENGTLKT